jgi:hypothetical protein
MERKERRYFTVEEARALVPRLRGLLIALQAEKRELDQLLGELRRLAPLAFLNGHGAQLERIEQRVAELTRSIREKVRVIHQLGVEVKDLDMGIVDFRASVTAAKSTCVGGSTSRLSPTGTTWTPGFAGANRSKTSGGGRVSRGVARPGSVRGWPSQVLREPRRLAPSTYHGGLSCTAPRAVPSRAG